MPTAAHHLNPQFRNRARILQNFKSVIRRLESGARAELGHTAWSAKPSAGVQDGYNSAPNTTGAASA
jgi:hypothetical protein